MDIYETKKGGKHWCFTDLEKLSPQVEKSYGTKCKRNGLVRIRSN